MQRISYYFFRCLVYLFALMPFWVLYIGSFKLYVVLYYIVKYRRDVVYDNLTKAFPEKTAKEIKTSAKMFYKHLANITLESFKGFSMSHASLVKHYKVTNMEVLDNYCSNGQSVILVGGHYGNWEWGSMSSGLQANYPLIIFYKPLSNKYIDAFMIKSRSRCGSVMTSIDRTYRAFKKQNGAPSFFLLIADQCPSTIDKAYWVDFLGIETAFLHGPELYAKMLKYPVVFLDKRCVKRGYYEVDMVPITETPSELPDGELTARYANLLESRIRKEPEYWLWSHRRWKHGR